MACICYSLKSLVSPKIMHLFSFWFDMSWRWQFCLLLGVCLVGRFSLFSCISMIILPFFLSTMLWAILLFTTVYDVSRNFHFFHNSNSCEAMIWLPSFSYLTRILCPLCLISVFEQMLHRGISCKSFFCWS